MVKHFIASSIDVLSKQLNDFISTNVRTIISTNLAFSTSNMIYYILIYISK